MERLLQYVWKYKLYSEAELTTTEGIPVEVTDPGIPNTDAGPDFFNAKVRIGDKVWAGNVEIHHKSSDWQSHGHQHDPAYDNVILHVAEECDVPVFRTDGEAIPQVIMHIPQRVKENMDWLLSRDTLLPCGERIHEVEEVHLSAWMNALLGERLERKTNDILHLLDMYKDDWNEVFYIVLTRNFGFGTNSDAFEWLAKSLPFQYIRKQRCNALQIEALLFGQAGLLNEEIADPYYNSLQQEYLFLQKKYKLKPVDGFLFKKLRTRPVNFPHLRLAQLAAVWTNHDTLFSKILENNRVETLTTCFNVALPEYWDTHFHFRYPSPLKKKTIGISATNIVMINTVAPVLFAYGRKKNQPSFCNRALQLLEEIPPEHNSLITPFIRAGIPVKNAADTQALIQLRREYCEKKKCLYCRIGFRLIKTAKDIA
ncbi:MAG: DUF2851 family protein [Tannerella sp.]|jgi:hypothetical protein|nr:DUF2851 family protein [Tannerella sp.]